MNVQERNIINPHESAPHSAWFLPPYLLCEKGRQEWKQMLVSRWLTHFKIKKKPQGAHIITTAPRRTPEEAEIAP